MVEKPELKKSKTVRINIHDKRSDEKVDAVHDKIESILAKI